MMNVRSMLCMLAASVAAGLPAQEESKPEAIPPVKVEQPKAAKQDPGTTGAVPKPQSTKDTAALIEDLGSDSYRERLDAERALRAKGKDARAELEKAAAGAEDAEVQWRARRLLRQLDRAGAEDLAPRGGAGQDPVVTEPDEPMQRGRPFRMFRSGGGQDDPMRAQFEALFEQFERDMGLDIPRARFFHDDFFKDLQDQMGKAGGRSHGMSMQIGPDGAVKVEVQEKGEDGKAETKVYEAPDMESFQKQYPGVLQRNGLGMGLFPGTTLRGFGPMRGFQFHPAPVPADRFEIVPDHDLPTLDDVTEGQAPAAPPAGKRLGISIRPEIAPELRDHLGLEEGVGLQVEAVAEGSLAAALGLQRGDIVTKVAGKSIGSPADVQQALGAIDKGSEVEVTFVRKGAEKTAKTAKTEAVGDDAESAKTAPAPKTEKLQPRQKGGTIR